MSDTQLENSINFKSLLTGATVVYCTEIKGTPSTVPVPVLLLPQIWIFLEDFEQALRFLAGFRFFKKHFFDNSLF